MVDCVQAVRDACLVGFFGTICVVGAASSAAGNVAGVAPPGADVSPLSAVRAGDEDLPAVAGIEPRVWLLDDGEVAVLQGSVLASGDWTVGDGVPRVVMSGSGF